MAECRTVYCRTDDIWSYNCQLLLLILLSASMITNVLISGLGYANTNAARTIYSPAYLPFTLHG